MNRYIMGVVLLDKSAVGRMEWAKVRTGRLFLIGVGCITMGLVW